MATPVVVEWNGQDVPEALRGLPAGRYVLSPVDEAVTLSEEEERGLIIALESARKKVLSHGDAVERARKDHAGSP
jgi:hypothetical protein